MRITNRRFLHEEIDQKSYTNVSLIIICLDSGEIEEGLKIKTFTSSYEWLGSK